MSETGSVLDMSRLECIRHVCGFFRGENEQYAALLPFIREGIENGERAFHIVDPKCKTEHLQRLRDAGINVATAEQNGQLEVRVWEEAHLRDGCFRQDAMLALIEEEVLKAGKTRGFPFTRFVGNMEWGLEDCPGVHEILEYETRLNYLLPKYDDTVICTYDLARFSADLVMDMLRTHPAVILGGVLYENPFYIPPDQFLKELSEREIVTRKAGRE